MRGRLLSFVKISCQSAGVNLTCWITPPISFLSNKPSILRKYIRSLSASGP
jgi:hypothetical protein